MFRLYLSFDVNFINFIENTTWMIIQEMPSKPSSALQYTEVDIYFRFYVNTNSNYHIRLRICMFSIKSMCRKIELLV